MRAPIRPEALRSGGACRRWPPRSGTSTRRSRRPQPVAGGRSPRAAARPTTSRRLRSRRARRTVSRAGGHRARRGARASTTAGRADRPRTRAARPQGRAGVARRCRVRRRGSRTAPHRAPCGPSRGLRRNGRRATVPARNGPVHAGSMSGRARQSSSGATRRRPNSSSSTCGGGSTSTCIARHSATRTAVLSGSLDAPATSRSQRLSKRSVAAASLWVMPWFLSVPAVNAEARSRSARC